jgi:16S rRNA (adenine1518-N6/adenine1519-N6)-dimethyltransferase
MSDQGRRAPENEAALGSHAGIRHRPRKRFGQNFLHDPRVIARIVDAIDPGRGQTVVEIGPGQAALTRELVRRAGHITAIEIDRDLAARLRTEFSTSQLTLLEADALTFDWSRVQGRLRVVGNLPYNISSPLLFALAAIADRVVDQHFMLQKEVVERMVAPPGSRTYGRLSVMLQHRYTMTRLFDVPRGAFNPPPQVTSSIVRMVPLPADVLPDVDARSFALVVAAAFGQRRKTLRNALSALLDADAIASTGVDPKSRAETLTNEQFVALARKLSR